MNQPLNLVFANARCLLQAAGVETSGYELRLLAAEVLGLESGEFCVATAELTESQLRQFQALVAKRAAHMPIDKILGRRGFYKYDFKVSTAVLSPRPDTEILLEAALEFVRRESYNTVLELGVGSGCIISSLLAESHHLHGIGVDISAPALDMAAENAVALGVENRLLLQEADWFNSDFAALLDQRFDLIVSNPPYIPSAEIPSLEPEVKNYDPLPALDGGEDGLTSYRRIAELAPILLNNNGRILLEVGEGQAQEVAEIFTSMGLQYEKTLLDLGQIERCVILKK